MADERHIFRNDMPSFSWVFMAFWLGALGLFAWLGASDDTKPMDRQTAGILGFMGLVGVAGAIHFMRTPCSQTLVENGEIIVRWRWPWRIEYERFPAKGIAPPAVVKESDSEGGLYFRCAIATPSGRRLSIAEGFRRAPVETARERFVAALAK